MPTPLIKKSKVQVPTFLKWAGGKTQLLDQFSDIFPKHIDCYVEPFLGGGAVLFYVLKTRKPKRACAYDINKDLIDVYVQIRDNSKDMIAELGAIQKEHNNHRDPKQYYLQRREEYNHQLKIRHHTKHSLVRKAALFIYLNKSCFNGLYRVNSKGEFNVPFGQYNTVTIFDEETIKEASGLLRGVKLEVKDFRKIRFPSKCTAYFDPPYWPENNTGFTSYTKLDFGKEDQERLAKLFTKLNTEGRNLILSNSNTPFIEELYAESEKPLVRIHRVNARWMINCQGQGRNVLKEIVVVNFERDQKELKGYAE